MEAYGKSTRSAEKHSELRITPISSVWCEQKVSQHIRILPSYYSIIYVNGIRLLLFRFNITDKRYLFPFLKMAWNSLSNVIIKGEKNSCIALRDRNIKNVDRIVFRKRQNAIPLLSYVSLSSSIVS